MLDFFKNYSLFRQLLIPILIVGIISACATIYSANQLENSLIALEEVYVSGESKLRILEEIETLSSSYRRLILRHLSYENSSSMKKAKIELAKISETLVEKIKLISTQTVTSDKEVLNKTILLTNNFEQYFKIIDKLIYLSSDFEKELAFEMLGSAEDDYLSEVSHILQFLKRHSFEEIGASRNQIQSLTKHNLYMTILVGLLGGVLILFTAYLVTQQVVWRLDKILIWSKKISQGNYSAAIDTSYHDEVGMLSKAMSDMASNIKNAHTDLAASKEQAELANRSKSEFLAMMSHEIRTPMNAVLGMNTLALESELPAKTRNYIEKAYLSAEALLDIINDILDFSKIEAGKLQLDLINFDLNHFLHKLDSILSHKAHEKKLEFIYDIDPDIPQYLYGDPMRLNQILLNLGNNAIKFTDQGSVTIRIKLLDKTATETYLQFEVIDSGVGIEKEKQDLLFQPFIQADSSISRKYGGTGLGLVISKRLVEMMKGQIYFKSKIGKGSSFIFTAKIKIDINAPATDYAIDEKASLARILVVDDNADIRNILISVLNRFGFQAESAESGSKALEKIHLANTQGTKFRIVLMDLLMPELNGLETVKKMQQLLPSNLLPIIIMMFHPYDSEQLQNQIEELTYGEVLNKPITPSSLLDSIHTAMGLKESTQHVYAITQQNNVDIGKELAGSRILVVEDNELNQELVVELLSKVEVDITIANNGQEAIDILNKKVFDGVLMDIQMPVMDGLTATRLIRQQECFRKLPIIALTANTMIGDREKVLEVGMNDHISKPINYKQMIETMIKWIKPEMQNKTTTSESIVETEISDAAEPKRLDTELGIKLCGGKSSFYTKMLHKVIELHKDFASEFNDARVAGDSELFTRIAHTLKSSAANIGALKLQTVSLELEKMCRKQATDDEMDTQLKTVEKELLKLSQLIHQIDLNE